MDGVSARDFCHCSTDRGLKWMDRPGIRFDLAIVISVDALTRRTPVRAHVSHSTLLVSCRLLLFSPLSGEHRTT